MEFFMKTYFTSQNACVKERSHFLWNMQYAHTSVHVSVQPLLQNIWIRKREEVERTSVEPFPLFQPLVSVSFRLLKECIVGILERRVKTDSAGAHEEDADVQIKKARRGDAANKTRFRKSKRDAGGDVLYFKAALCAQLGWSDFWVFPLSLASGFGIPVNVPVWSLPCAAECCRVLAVHAGWEHLSPRLRYQWDFPCSLQGAALDGAQMELFTWLVPFVVVQHECARIHRGGGGWEHLESAAFVTAHQVALKYKCSHSWNPLLYRSRAPAFEFSPVSNYIVAHKKRRHAALELLVTEKNHGWEWEFCVYEALGRGDYCNCIFSLLIISDQCVFDYMVTRHLS